MNPTKEMKKAIAAIIGKAYKSCVKKERRAARATLKLAGKRASDWNRDNITVNHPYDKVRRNETCPCESGTKYKRCCLIEVQKSEAQVAIMTRKAQDDRKANNKKAS